MHKFEEKKIAPTAPLRKNYSVADLNDPEDDDDDMDLTHLSNLHDGGDISDNRMSVNEFRQEHLQRNIKQIPQYNSFTFGQKCKLLGRR